MKKVLFLMAALVSASVSLQAQNQGEKKFEKKQLTQEEKTEMHTKMMAKRLMLDDANATRFEKVYKNYQNEMQKLHKKGNWKKDMTDAERENNLKDNWAMMKKKADTQEKYYKEFRKFLTVKQTEQVLANRGGMRNHRAGNHMMGHRTKQMARHQMKGHGSMKKRTHFDKQGQRGNFEFKKDVQTKKIEKV